MYNTTRIVLIVGRSKIIVQRVRENGAPSEKKTRYYFLGAVKTVANNTRSNQKVSRLIVLFVSWFEYERAHAIVIVLYMLGKRIRHR